ncbi:MAG: GGDEF domain-containing protein [Candidatus Dormibacteraeota bacterium]|nr:GGDEF domain-containing protein [Candidatus Dormibacteraeota bacterium]
MQPEFIEGVGSLDRATPTRVVAGWLGLTEEDLGHVPEWFIEAVALRLTSDDPNAGLREELLLRLRDAMNELQELARTDGLTGLANRRTVEERLEHEVDRARRHSRDVSVLLLDIDGLKQVNDGLGHATGDALLRAVGTRVARAVRRTDLAGRWGGDEFIVVCPETGGEAVRGLAHKLHRVVCGRPIKVNGRRIDVRASVGWAVDGVSGSAASLFAAADASLYAAKRRRPVDVEPHVRVIGSSRRTRSATRRSEG